jgi:carboxypeptidase family protein
MFKRQITAQNMYQSLLNVLTTFNSSWSTNTAISAVVTTLTSLLGLLGIAGTTQKNATLGITQSKAQARSSLIQMALAHSAAGMAYAASISNTTMRINSKLTESRLNKATDAAFVSLCMSLYNLLNPYASSLTAFGANAATLLAFKNAITAYQPVSQTPKNARAAKKSATLNVGAQLTSIDTLVKEQLDPLMVQFKTTNTDFYNQYMSLRHAATVSHHLKTITLQLHIKTAAGVALPNAEIKLTSIKHKKRKALSKADGSRTFTRLKADTFTIVVSLPGYVTQTQTITVSAPQKLPVNFVMVAATGTGGGTTTGTTPATA